MEETEWMEMNLPSYFPLTALQGIAEALQRAGAVYKYDLSVPLPCLYSLVEDMRARLSAGNRERAIGNNCG